MSILDSDDYEEFCRVIHQPGISDGQAEMLVRLHRYALETQKTLGTIQTEKVIALSDRDNRMRRMQIAHAILDETQVYDLDAIAEIIWPNPLTSHEFAEGVQQGSLHTQDGQPIYRQGAQVQSIPFPDISVPTRVPGEGDCSLGGQHHWIQDEQVKGTKSCACGAWVESRNSGEGVRTDPQS